MYLSLEGSWEAQIGDGKRYAMVLPGTLDENEIGHQDIGSGQLHPDSELGHGEQFAGTERIATRFTRSHTFEGEARLSRKLEGETWRMLSAEMKKGKRIFLEAERARVLRLFLDGREVPDWRPPSLSTRHVFEVTGLLREGSELTLVSDNSYPGLPHDAIVYSSAATDETQTNWNGVLGEIGFRTEEKIFLEEIRVYPKNNTITVKAKLCADEPEGGWPCADGSEAGKLCTGGVAAGKRCADESGEKWPCADGNCGEAPRKEGVSTVRIRLHCDALPEDLVQEVQVSRSVTELTFGPLPLREDVKRWDLEEGNLYELSLTLEKIAGPGNSSTTDSGETNAVVMPPAAAVNSANIAAAADAGVPASTGAGSEAAQPATVKTLRFGVRDFGDNGKGRLALNGRTIFLRGEANCCVFPETGYPPMGVEAWLEILKRYRSYGVNCMRFHSHCPPEAAFEAADRLGILMQPELSHWNPRNAFESEESFAYYRMELEQILLMLANHPSFVMLTFGNELHTGDKGKERMHKLLELARTVDGTRLYAIASNAFYGNQGCDGASDFYTSSNYHAWHLRATFANMEGYLNHAYPGAQTNFDDAMEQLRKEYGKPVFGFEVGQYEVLPDFGELEDFRGISRPENLHLIQEKVQERGLTEVWPRYVEATGELSRLCYREEVEAVLRTREMSGLSLLGLQDFPGQGTALVGMLNSHLQPKPYDFARPERFQSFFRDRLPLVLLPRYTWEGGETLSVRIQVANYGKEDLQGPLVYELRSKGESKLSYSAGIYCLGELSESCYSSSLYCLGELPERRYPAGELTEGGCLELALPSPEKPLELELRVRVGDCSNTYPLWVYPRVSPKCPEGIYEARYLDEKAKEVLWAGGRVYLAPPSTREALPHSIQAQFSPDFWSVGTFGGQEGGMGQLIDAEHPIFEAFPTEFYTNWQWWPMATQRAAILPKMYESIVTELDSYAFLRPMCQLLECRCGGGRLLFSTLGLQDLQQYPEARALLEAIYRYMDSERFEPKQEIGAEVFESLVSC